jgi:hypothetical protein
MSPVAMILPVGPSAVLPLLSFRYLACSSYVQYSLGCCFSNSHDDNFPVIPIETSRVNRHHLFKGHDSSADSQYKRKEHILHRKLVSCTVVGIECHSGLIRQRLHISS